MVSSRLSDSQLSRSQMSAQLDPPIRQDETRFRNLAIPLRNRRNETQHLPLPTRLSNLRLGFTRNDGPNLVSENNSGIISRSQHWSEVASQMERDDSIGHPQDNSRFNLNSSQYSREINNMIDENIRAQPFPNATRLQYANPLNLNRLYIPHGLEAQHPIELSGYQEVEIDHSGLHSQGLK